MRSIINENVCVCLYARELSPEGKFAILYKNTVSRG
ncbi:LexA family transcriptional regulator, partial [Klebsiella quasipneumoniae]